MTNTKPANVQTNLSGPTVGAIVADIDYALGANYCARNPTVLAAALHAHAITAAASALGDLSSALQNLKGNK